VLQAAHGGFTKSHRQQLAGFQYAHQRLRRANA
jgi:hypothetical protein